MPPIMASIDRESGRPPTEPGASIVVSAKAFALAVALMGMWLALVAANEPGAWFPF